MHTVYLLRSLTNPTKHYTGCTCDLEARLLEHNTGDRYWTRHYAPWECIVSVQFQDKDMAYAFERYLKSGSGRAFANRHFRS